MTSVTMAPEVLMSHTANIEAFDDRMALALAATGADADKVASAYQEELEKIAGFADLAGGLLRKGGKFLQEQVAKKLPGGASASRVQQVANKARSAGAKVQGALPMPTPSGPTAAAMGKAKAAPIPGAGAATSPKATAASMNPSAEGFGSAPKPTPAASATPSAQSTPVPQAAADGAKQLPTSTTQPPAPSPDAPTAQVPGATPEVPQAAGPLGGVSDSIKKHFGIDPKGGMDQFGAGWFKRLPKEQQDNLMMAGTATGAVGASMGAGMAAGLMAGGDGSNKTIVYT